VTRCLVTDRRRLCPEARTFAAARACLVEQARAAAAAGIDLIQIRERDLEAADLAALVADVVAVTRESRTRVVVNDRLDVALACRADGVHLRGDSYAVKDARRLIQPPLLVGRSVRTVEGAALAAGADYVIAGTVFPSASKPDAPPAQLLGLDGLRKIVHASAMPVLAIGGITPDRIDEVLAAGADGIAAIGLFIDSLKSAS
jgi:thiamine-phosphate pyrophosphorylase